MGRQLRVVSDEDEGGLLAAVQAEQQVEDHLAIDGVEIAGGFVCHEDRRADHEGTRQGHALLFAAGELDGVVIAAIGETNEVEQFAGAAGADVFAATAQFVGKEDVLLGRQGGDQLVSLKNEPNLAAADHGQFILGEAGDVGTVEDDFYGGWGTLP